MIRGMPPGEIHPFLELIRRRVTVERFDASKSLSEEQIRELVADAVLAPSSFNIQHWRFVAVRGAREKQQLQAAAFGQEQVGQAAVTFVILGDLQGCDGLDEALQPAVQSGVMPAGKAAAWVRMANDIYGDPAMARDEAIRSASLAAMTMMLAAEARGLASGALSGFDPTRVKELFGISERYLPVLLLSVGHPLEREGARMPRLGVERVLRFDHGGDFE